MATRPTRIGITSTINPTDFHPAVIALAANTGGDSVHAATPLADLPRSAPHFVGAGIVCLGAFAQKAARVIGGLPSRGAVCIARVELGAVRRLTSIAFEGQSVAVALTP